MFNTIEEYLDALKNEMKDADPALAQDAQADAREHLTMALKASREKQPDLSDTDALKVIIDGYGSPEETASAYREVERRTSPSLNQPAKPRSASGYFFGVYTDPRAWGALLYMFIAFVTGVFYFTWAVTGLSVSLSFALFIFGLPFALLFFLSLRGLALLEGRIVEALLGIRMPRRPWFSKPNLKWLDRLKELALDKYTWMAILYMFLQFILGTVYFTVTVVILSFSLSLIAIPILQELTDIGYFMNNGIRYSFPVWSYPLLVLGGFLLWTIYMNLAREVTQLHGRLAKWMLVAD
ncbi:MAG: sensor domain-containing protein [Anaerolineales bacterium]|nr:sensor domain-containing protein [Anaerolineales bacterium]